MKLIVILILIFFLSGCIEAAWLQDCVDAAEEHLNMTKPYCERRGNWNGCECWNSNCIGSVCIKDDESVKFNLDYEQIEQTFWR